MRVTILGCGTSTGVPRLGGKDGQGDWGSCDPAEPRNRRRRAALLVPPGGGQVLVDTGPDLRAQLLDAGIGRLDAVLFTHDHADHVHGIDDLRQLFHNARRPVDCYADATTWSVLAKRFDYVFKGSGGYPATCTMHVLPRELRIGGLTIRHFRQRHGNVDSQGYRFDADGRATAYSTDVQHMPEIAFDLLGGLDLWVVDALRRLPHPTHSHLAQTLGWIARAGPKRALLTHMDGTMDYRTLVAELPAGVEPGYDGLTIEL